MLEAGYENWRLGVREIPYDRRHPCASWVAYAGTVTTEPDTVDFSGDSVLFYHRNRNDRLLLDTLIPQQGLTPVADQIPNTQRNRTFGGVDARSWTDGCRHARRAVCSYAAPELAAGQPPGRDDAAAGHRAAHRPKRNA